MMSLALNYEKSYAEFIRWSIKQLKDEEEDMLQLMCEHNCVDEIMGSERWKALIDVIKTHN
jgi:hypothetical protein